MILELVGALFGAFLVSLVGHLLIVGARNRKAHELFKKRAIGLKILEDPALFGGHSRKVYYAKYNWKIVEKILDEYGPTVGLLFGNLPTVVTKDLDFVKTFTVDEQIHINRVQLNLPFKEIEDDCILFAEDEQWLRLRKAIAPAFSAHKIKLPNVQADIQSVIDKLVGLIDRRLDEAKTGRQEDFYEADAEDICHRFSLASVFTNFYKQPDFVDFESSQDKWVHQIESVLPDLVGFFAKACVAFPGLRRPFNWLVLNFHPQGKMRNTVMNLIKRQTKQNFEAAKEIQTQLSRQQDNVSVRLGKIVEGKQGFNADNFTLNDGSKFRRNMIDYVIDQYREGKLTRSEYFNSTFFLFFAADKTASDALSRLFYNLAHHQQIQKKLRESILESGVDSEYLSWVVHESLRMDPPAPVGCSRTIKRDIQTKHGLVPAGTYVLTPARTIGRLKEYWGPDADEFRPERWANAKSFHPCQFLAFGGGRRACPGKELALMEIKMLLNVLVRRYRFDKSQLHPIDNSNNYGAPLFMFMVYDTPTFVRISRLSS